MAKLVSKYSEILEVVLELSINESSSINAKKYVKAHSKNIAKTYSDHINALLSVSGRICGMSIRNDSTDILISGGKFINNGIICYSTDTTAIVDDGLLIEPYYLYGYINNDSSVPLVEFGLDQDSTNNYAYLGIKDNSDWTSLNPIELGGMWRNLIDHNLDESIHSNELVNYILDSSSHPDGTNIYLTKNDLILIDSTTGRNQIIDSLQNLIECEKSCNKIYFNNMFADTIENINENILIGKYNTFYNAWVSGNASKYGIYNDSQSQFSFETPIIRNINNIDKHILLTTKHLSVGVETSPTFDISTDGSTYQILNQPIDTIIDSTSLSPNYDGIYELKFKFNLPAISGGNYWTSKQSLTNKTSLAGCQFLNNRSYIIGGFDNTSVGSGIQEYLNNNDSFTIYLSDFYKQSISTSLNISLDKIVIFNSCNSSMLIDDNIYELNISNKSIVNIASGLSRYGSSSSKLAINDVNSYFGMGRDSSSFTSDFKILNELTRTVSSKNSFPISASGVSSILNNLYNKKIYNYGAHTPSGTLSNFNYYSCNDDSYTTINFDLNGSVNSTTKSYSESCALTHKNSILYPGISTGDVGSENFSFNMTEYNIKTNILFQKTNMSYSIGHLASCVSLNGNMYSFGGRSDNSSPHLSLDNTLEYTPDAALYLIGWGVEWR